MIREELVGADSSDYEHDAGLASDFDVDAVGDKTMSRYFLLTRCGTLDSINDFKPFAFNVSYWLSCA